MVAYDSDKAFLEKTNTLVPCACKVVLLADRGCTDTEWLRHRKRLGWHLRLRIKANLWIDQPGHGGSQVRAISLGCGQARCWHGGWLTIKRCGPVHLAVARPLASDECWGRVCSDLTSLFSGEICAFLEVCSEYHPSEKTPHRLLTGMRHC
jgi:hypothetical protein